MHQTILDQLKVLFQDPSDDEDDDYPGRQSAPVQSPQCAKIGEKTVTELAQSQAEVHSISVLVLQKEAEEEAALRKLVRKAD